jgi:hypothetical protein
VELKTVSNARLWTDSAGYAAIDDPAWMGRKVFFTITSHGYEFPADGMGSRGAAIDLAPGGEATLKIKRLNIAERLYRITGEGIYADSVKLGKPTPIAEPLLNGQVTGQDSALTTIYQGTIWWFWGDTLRQSYPLGHFSTAGATSELPGVGGKGGGLDPSIGVNLKYFVDKSGFSRPMVPANGAELHWIDGLTTVKDDNGRERLIATLTRLKSLREVVSRELIAFNDDTGLFDSVSKFDVKSPIWLSGHPFRKKGDKYIYCGQTWPNLRVKADWKSVTDPASYEAYDPATATWKPNSLPANTPLRLHDVLTGRSVEAQNGSVRWNPYRNKWVMIVGERGGKSSFLGEIWYAEAPEPQGPWKEARKIITHDRYSYYNPVQHDFFDREGGRYIYFEGTYTATFSRDGDATPRYDYNQMMYRLDLADKRLGLPSGGDSIGNSR